MWDDGWVGEPITATDLIQIARRDLAALESAGFLVEVIDVEPLEVVDTEWLPELEHASSRTGGNDHEART
ncbi:hypothetical protein AWN90_13900 [Nocardia terpenica]|uniref:Uncharacterized protein n=1 Tax=Nocardia terpenica TaxID=455432 RepID=A0A164HWE4_9NOCA|nr:hypothetical protein AWN90_13900 [Nocardia terpenica]